MGSGEIPQIPLFEGVHYLEGITFSGSLGLRHSLSTPVLVILSLGGEVLFSAPRGHRIRLLKAVEKLVSPPTTLSSREGKAPGRMNACAEYSDVPGIG